MDVKSVLVLSPADVREMLVQWYVEFLTNDQANLGDLLRQGMLQKLPNLKLLNDESITKQFDELGISESLAEKHNVTQVLVELEPGTKWELVWDIGNVPPKEFQHQAEQLSGYSFKE